MKWRYVDVRSIDKEIDYFLAWVGKMTTLLLNNLRARLYSVTTYKTINVAKVESDVYLTPSIEFIIIIINVVKLIYCKIFTL